MAGFFDKLKAKFKGEPEKTEPAEQAKTQTEKAEPAEQTKAQTEKTEPAEQTKEEKTAGLTADQKEDILSAMAQYFGGGEAGHRIAREFLEASSEAAEDKSCPAPSRLAIKPGAFVTMNQINGQWMILVVEDRNGQPGEIICSDPIPDAILNGKDPLTFSNYLYNRAGFGIDVTRLQVPDLTKRFPALEKCDMLRNQMFYAAESLPHGESTPTGRAAMLDIAVNSGIISVACIINPSKVCDVSLYHSNGSACIGLGRSSQTIANAAVKVINSAVHAISELEKTNYTPRPEPSASVGYYILRDGVYKAQILTDSSDELNSAIQTLRHIPEFQAKFNLLANSKHGSLIM